MISVYIKFIWMIVFTFLIFFIVRSVHSETMNDLIWEKGIYYKKYQYSFQWKDKWKHQRSVPRWKERRYMVKILQ